MCGNGKLTEACSVAVGEQHDSYDSSPFVKATGMLIAAQMIALMSRAKRKGDRAQTKALRARTRHRHDKLDDSLVGKPDCVVDEPGTQKICRDLLLFGKSAIEAADENIGVNERGDGRTAPRASNLVPAKANPGIPSWGVDAGARQPCRTP
jgi:hypothetical protein